MPSEIVLTRPINTTQNGNGHRKNNIATAQGLSDILLITTYPPRECGIATYSQDLVGALNNKFFDSFGIKICAIESESDQYDYAEPIKYRLNVHDPQSFIRLAKSINRDSSIKIVFVQHEFGLFEKRKDNFNQFLGLIEKPVIMAFHTIVPNPTALMLWDMKQLSANAHAIIVMTQSSAQILMKDYEVQEDKIIVIPHGTHLVPQSGKDLLKQKYNLLGKKVLSTFGLLSSGKNIETTLDAMPDIIKAHPDVLFVIIGKTHPSVVKHDGEQYRKMLEEKVIELKLQEHVKFVNQFLPLPELLEYLQLTDVYLFTSKDPNQAVSGTFSYALSCGCPIVSTPIPHVKEVLQNGVGVIIDFECPDQLKEAVIGLLSDASLRREIGSNALHKMASTAWENSAIAHAHLFEKISGQQIKLKYKLPTINLDHVRKMTTGFGMIQFSKINQPDIGSGYTIDDNARAMVAMCQHYELTKDKDDLAYIFTYFAFLKHCLQTNGYFLNYVDEQRKFTEQNNTTNLADANGRAIWALGYLISKSEILPFELIENAQLTIQAALTNVGKIHSTRAMAFIIKGLYYRNIENKSMQDLQLIKELGNRLVQMYKHEAHEDWQWFESYLTYANSTLPEAMLCAWLATGDTVYKDIAKSSFDFLLSKTFKENSIHVISNKSWLSSEQHHAKNIKGGEQPIDVAYTIMALSKFYHAFNDVNYLHKLEQSFDWFLGNNHLNQIIYNPCTGGCYDGLEENYVNLNQGAESTVSYLMARLTIEKIKAPNQVSDINERVALIHRSIEEFSV